MKYLSGLILACLILGCSSEDIPRGRIGKVQCNNVLSGLVIIDYEDDGQRIAYKLCSSNIMMVERGEVINVSFDYNLADKCYTYHDIFIVKHNNS